MSALDTQVGGTHYARLKIQPVEFIMKYKLDFCQGNILKYVVRYISKNGTEDLDKALQYMRLKQQLQPADFMMAQDSHKNNISKFCRVNELSRLQTTALFSAANCSWMEFESAIDQMKKRLETGLD